jgi:hypothetical protein
MNKRLQILLLALTACTSCSNDVPAENLQQQTSPTIPDSCPTENSLNGLVDDFAYQIEQYPRWSENGRLFRTLQFHKVIQYYEEDMHVPQGTIAGMIMELSGGNQLAVGPNGEAGLMQIMPGTAAEWNLKIFGASRSTRADREHARQLNAFVADGNYDSTANGDQRFDICASIKVGSYILGHLYDRYDNVQATEKNWDNALFAYQHGHLHEHPEESAFVSRVKAHQKRYNEVRADLSLEQLSNHRMAGLK